MAHAQKPLRKSPASNADRVAEGRRGMKRLKEAEYALGNSMATMVFMHGKYSWVSLTRDRMNNKDSYDTPLHSRLF